MVVVISRQAAGYIGGIGVRTHIHHHDDHIQTHPQRASEGMHSRVSCQDNMVTTHNFRNHAIALRTCMRSDQAFGHFLLIGGRCDPRITCENNKTRLGKVLTTKSRAWVGFRHWPTPRHEGAIRGWLSVVKTVMSRPQTP